jgi:hypothetical protein
MAGRLSRHRPDGECRRVPDYRMLLKGTALMRYAQFPTINSVLSNAPELRLQSRHVVGVPMENRPTMTRLDRATELPHSNEKCKTTQCGTPPTPPARGTAAFESKYGFPI